MTILFIFGGNKFDTDYAALADTFMEKVGRFARVDVLYAGVKETDPDRARSKESERIDAALKDGDKILLFDERGKETDSPSLARLLDEWGGSAKRNVIIVGGAWGVTDAVRTRADKVISFSPMIFPHQLARIMAIEQTYRALSINAGSRYHHE